MAVADHFKVDLPRLTESRFDRRAVPKEEIAPIVKVKAQKKRAEKKVVLSIRAQVVERAKGHCERCGKPCRTTGEAHHKIHRSQGGKWTLANIIFVCKKCHGAAHGVKR